jgi:hypothetical protein
MTFAKDSSWHKCEVPTASRNVWCWGQSRKHLLARSISHLTRNGHRRAKHIAQFRDVIRCSRLLKGGRP